MTSTAINLTVRHTRSREDAFERVLKCLQSQKDAPTFAAFTVKPLETLVYHDQFKLVTKICITILGREETHTLTFQVNSSDVRVTSDEPDNIVERGIFWGESGRLQTMLADALK